MPVNSFRFALLLSTWPTAFILAERCAVSDEAEYEGLVNFTAIDDFPRVYAELSRLSTAHKSQVARARASLFAQRFSHPNLFQRAGIAALLSWVEAGRSGDKSISRRDTSGDIRFETATSAGLLQKEQMDRQRELFSNPRGSEMSVPRRGGRRNVAHCMPGEARTLYSPMVRLTPHA